MATKAWNRLFAVADWAASRLKQRQPVEPKPTLRETLRQLVELHEQQKALDKWRPSTLNYGDPGFKDDDVYKATLDYLTAWRRKNYGKMAQFIPQRLLEETSKAAAGRVREECDFWKLDDFEIERVEHVAPAACEVDVVLTFADGSKPARLRWIHEHDGQPTTPGEPGDWLLYVWGPMAILNRATPSSADTHGTME